MMTNYQLETNGEPPHSPTSQIHRSSLPHRAEADLSDSESAFVLFLFAAPALGQRELFNQVEHHNENINHKIKTPQKEYFAIYSLKATFQQKENYL